jgi:uncharacterized protein YecE (DUF72 family)
VTKNEIQIGTIGYPLKKQLVHSRVDVVELIETAESPPKLATARRWRKATPDRIGFTMQLPRYLFEQPPANSPLPGPADAYGRFQTTEENQRLMTKSIRFASALKAHALVLPTPADFTPAKVHRDALEKFLAVARPDNLDIVWEPRGPWEYESAAAFARDLGVTLAIDPLQDPPQPDKKAYFRLGPFSVMGARMGIYHLEQLIEAFTLYEEVTCVFATPMALDDIQNLKNLMAEIES